MKRNKKVFVLLLVLIFINLYSQQKSIIPKIKVSGEVIEKDTKQKIEYATLSFYNDNSPKVIAIGATNSKGEFNIEIDPGIYNIKIELISMKPIFIKNRNLIENTSLGKIILEEDTKELNEVIVRSEKTSVDIKLDKKVYSIGNDLMVKGGTVSDVLNNIPSVSVDPEGAISLRGNENVTLFIDGKPSNAINLNEALRLIPADAIDKVEVITNPSSRYDAEGGAGILNIILKKGKNLGFNGTLISSLGFPENNSLSATINYKTKKFNFFTNQGYAKRLPQGNALFETNYFNPKPESPNFIKETRNNEDLNKTYNGNLGMDWYLSKAITWTNSINYRNSNEKNIESVNFNNFFLDTKDNFLRTRLSSEKTNSEDLEFKSNFNNKFKKEGHTLNLDLQLSSNKGIEIANILDSKNGNDLTQIDQKSNRKLIQADYILPFGKNKQFEAGYRGNFTDQLTNILVYNNNLINNNFSNKLEYLEKVNALYSQYGSKLKKISFLLGLRWENTNVDVNNYTSKNFVPKKYNNFFPSSFITYTFKDESNISINYSRRISRPRGRLINPFNNYSSNINIFQGNINLNPAISNLFDFGYLKKWSKMVLNTSVYTNRTSDAFIIVRINSGDRINGIPIIITTPINIESEIRTGMEFNLNYSLNKWLKLNGNFNYFNIKSKGNNSYIDFNNVQVNQFFDQNTNTWTARLNSKVTLPYKIDWQTNMTYSGDQNTVQAGVIKGIYAMNLGFSKDILKDKASISLNVSDVFNSRKLKLETLIENDLYSNIIRQRNVRQFTLSFTYRLNRSKNEKEKQPRKEFEEGGVDFSG